MANTHFHAEAPAIFKLGSLSGRTAAFLIAGLIALAAVILFAAFPPSNGSSAPAAAGIIAAALLLALASGFVGALLGFLFGIPRRLQQTSNGEEARDLGIGPGYETNTNLEQISDWLTKILVGVGLVQLAQITEIVNDLGNFVEKALGPGAGRVIGVSLVILFFILGFLLGYVWTRIRLADEFSQSERDGQVKPQFYEGLMHAYLYLPAPSGFERTLSIGQKLEKRFPDAMNDRVWTYIACAYGQKFSFESRKSNPDQAKLTEYGNSAYEAVRSAVEYAESSKEGLQLLLNGSDGGDLLPFKKDERFQSLVREE